MMLTLLEQIEARVDSLLATNSLQLRTNNGLQSCLVTPGATCTLGQEISTAWMREDWGAQRGGLHELEVWGTGFARIRFGVESAVRHTYGQKQSVGGKCWNGSGHLCRQRNGRKIGRASYRERGERWKR